MKSKLFIFLILGVSILASGCQTAIQKKNYPETFKGPEEILATNLYFDQEKGVIRYTLPKPALVRLRAGIAGGGPLLKTLIDWEERPAGENIETWDKKDADGKIDFSGRTDLILVLKCIPVDTKEYNFSLSRMGYKKSPQLNISFPNSSLQEDGIPIIKGIAPVRLSLDNKETRWLEEVQYEIGLYIDYIFLIEEEQGANPFNYQLDTNNFNDGLHVITMNLTTYEGEIGTRNILVYVKNKK